MTKFKMTEPEKTVNVTIQVWPKIRTVNITVIWV